LRTLFDSAEHVVRCQREPCGRIIRHTTMEIDRNS
jgi:hypothetical protein